MILVENMSKIKEHGQKTQVVEPNEGEDEKNIFTYDIEAGAKAFVKIINVPVNKLNENLIKTVKDNVGVNDYKTNVKALMTKWNLSNRYIDRLHQIIKEHLPITDHTDYKTYHNFLETWGAIYKHQDFCKIHSHVPCSYSWVYYAQVDDKSSPLEIFNIIKEEDKTLNNIRLQPKTGQLVIFPSFVQHGVKKTGGIGEEQWRIVLAGNIIVEWHE